MYNDSTRNFVCVSEFIARSEACRVEMKEEGIVAETEDERNK